MASRWGLKSEKAAETNGKIRETESKTPCARLFDSHDIAFLKIESDKRDFQMLYFGSIAVFKLIYHCLGRRGLFCFDLAIEMK